ncbi:hypothetical protein EYC84_002627 [Monilinia fructicola]|uniref:Uncharacterized protein n=1 Tax=Monilinia fructicola TaxID=38448 RepID=A0A5M9JTZ6_MONFR|nr:hypothetical protein EYC84_002627 [Monilinia fructicola]
MDWPHLGVFLLGTAPAHSLGPISLIVIYPAHTFLKTWMDIIALNWIRISSTRDGIVPCIWLGRERSSRPMEDKK